MKKININLLLIIFGSIAAVFIVIFLIWWNVKIEIVNQFKDGAFFSSGNKKQVSSISGQECTNYAQRPISVMLGGDLIARPLSGISQADIVFEMPVAPNGITRFMAVFQCEHPEEIGSIRSARQDFIPLAAGLGSIYAHWGGERDALADLDSRVMDNINAMKYDGTVFYRKTKIKPPYNGFTTIENLTEEAKNLKYALDDNFLGYPHNNGGENKSISNMANEVDVNYPKPFNAKWIYNDQENNYARYRNNEPEIDKDNNTPVTASVVIIMETTSKFLREQYITVSVQGEGSASFYQNGIVATGKWKKDPSSIKSKLYFYGPDGKEIDFVPGKIWVEIVPK